ncbi:uncharacterized protein DC041_0000434 [Schistosoma bovis]|uniref:Uncharacterized protein n=1 Tax=Schistosoma bovis TaxID=6184 RepID=A0A430QNA7_SCHBO|nr:uncharacterized protein DC041_0000434 [Schistosoma bovis]
MNLFLFVPRAIIDSSDMTHPGLSIIKLPTTDLVSGNNSTESAGEKVAQRVVLFPKQSNSGSQLIWRGACLQSILSDVPSQNTQSSVGQLGNNFGETLQRKIVNINPFEDKPLSLSLTSVWNQNQQDATSDGICPLNSKNKNLKRPRNESNPNNPEGNSDSSEEKSPTKVRATKPRIRSQTKRSGRRNAPKPVQQPLLLTLRPFHPPGNLLLPAFDLMSKFDGLVSFENDKLVTNNTSSSLSTINEENIEETSTTLNASVSTTGRMKSSAGINDIDFEEFKHYRRLNGYSLFVHVNKKKYGSFPGSTLVDDTNDANDNMQTGLDGLVSFENDKLVTNNTSSSLSTINEENIEETSTTLNASVSTTGRMKSSAGINDIDFEEFKHYRRLNGYSLFVHVNKKKYGSFPGSTLVDDTNDANDNMQTGLGISSSGKESQKSNRRWQALWLTVPEKVKREWKNKAKRLLKQIEQHGKREVLSEDRKLRERDRLEVQLSRTQTTFYSLLDLAAHFQLLSDRFATFSKNVNDYEGPIDPVGVESLLLDGLLTCLIPLIALTNELEPFTEVPDRKTICDALTNLTFIAPF